MPLDISNDAITEKNKLHSDNVWLLLIEITHESDPTVMRLVNNNVDITWPTAGGNLYTSTAFEMSPIKQDSEGSIPTVELKITDFGGNLINIIDEYAGGLGAKIKLRIVLSEYLDNIDPEYEDEYEIVDVSVDSKYNISFKLGSPNPLKFRIPVSRYIKDQCRYKEFKGTRCGYIGNEVDCDRTLKRCRELNNSRRIGAFPGMGSEGYNE